MTSKTWTSGTVIDSPWLQDVNDTTYGLPDTTSTAKGDALVGVKRTATGATATTVHNWIEGQVFNVKTDFGATGDGATNDYAALQAAIEAAHTAGGGIVYFPPGDYRHGTPLKTYSNISLIGAGQSATKLTKTGSGTLALTGSEATQANTNLVCLDLAKMSDGSGNVNCSIWLSDATRTEYVEIAHMTIRSTGSAATTANTRIGLCGMGASTSYIHDLTFEYYSVASVVMPTYFAASFHRVKSYRCVQGPSFEAGTSVSFLNNYSIYCQKYGYYFRDMSYITVNGNACDGLNNVSNASDYSDRTVDSRVYMFNACKGVTVTGNGAEQCFGSHIYLDSCVAVEVVGNTFYGPASSYTGANQVALFYVNSLAQDTRIEGNLILRGGVTAIQGAAVAANHHDLYVNVAGHNEGFRFVNNWTANNYTDAPSAIYGNVVPTYLNTTKQANQFFGDFTPVLTVPGATGVTITPTANNKGRYSIVNGFMDVLIELDETTVTFAGTGTITISGLPFANASTKNARLMVDHSSGFTWATTESYFLDIANGATSGTLKNRTDSVSGITTSVLTSGNPAYLRISGKIYVGDNLNVV